MTSPYAAEPCAPACDPLATPQADPLFCRCGHHSCPECGEDVHPADEHYYRSSHPTPGEKTP